MVTAVRHLGPNWYATVMGTAVVATAGVALPTHVPGLRTVCTAVWAGSPALLLVLLCARSLHWRNHRDQARAHLLDPATAPFYGCLGPVRRITPQTRGRSDPSRSAAGAHLPRCRRSPTPPRSNNLARGTPHRVARRGSG